MTLLRWCIAPSGTSRVRLAASWPPGTSLRKALEGQQVRPEFSRIQLELIPLSVHANSYIFLKGVAENPGPSSGHRLARFEELAGNVKRPADLLKVGALRVRWHETCLGSDSIGQR